MATRKVTIFCKHDDNGREFEESYLEGERASFPVGHQDPEAWARALVDNFNRTLRPGESSRTVLRVVVEQTMEAANLAHTWEKTNLVTVMGKGGQSYDTARCAVCGITAKRFGIGDHTRDPKFKAAVYETCNGAQVALAARKHK